MLSFFKKQQMLIYIRHAIIKIIQLYLQCPIFIINIEKRAAKMTDKIIINERDVNELR